jgi:hypothetical protein
MEGRQWDVQLAKQIQPPLTSVPNVGRNTQQNVMGVSGLYIPIQTSKIKSAKFPLS